MANLFFYWRSDEEVTRLSYLLAGWVKAVMIYNKMLLVIVAVPIVVMCLLTYNCRGKRCGIERIVAVFALFYLGMTWAIMYNQTLYFHKFICECKRVNSNPVHPLLVM